MNLGVSSKGEGAPAVTVIVTATAGVANTGEAESVHKGAAEAALRATAAAEARAPAGAAAGAQREAKTGPLRGGAKSAESAKKATREEGSLAPHPGEEESWIQSWRGRSENWRS